jgi:hypothetical protein
MCSNLVLEFMNFLLIGTRIKMLPLKLYMEEKPQKRLPRDKLGLQERLQCYLEFNTKI